MTPSDRLRAAVERARKAHNSIMDHDLLMAATLGKPEFNKHLINRRTHIANFSAALAEIEAIARELEDG